MDKYDEIKNAIVCYCSVNNASYSTQIVLGLSRLCAKMYSLFPLCLQCAPTCTVLLVNIFNTLLEYSIRVFDFIWLKVDFEDLLDYYYICTEECLKTAKFTVHENFPL